MDRRRADDRLLEADREVGERLRWLLRLVDTIVPAVNEACARVREEAGAPAAGGHMPRASCDG